MISWHKVKSLKMKYRNIKKNNLRNTGRIPYIHHIMLFIFREVLFCIILPLMIYPSIETNEGFYLVSDVIFLIVFNIFILFLTYNSVISQKIFTYYVSIVILIDHGVINMLILKTSCSLIDVANARLVTYMISISFILEAFVSIYLVYINRFLSWMDVFRKIGANTRVQSAFFYRQILKALIPYGFFVAFQQLDNVLFPFTGCMAVLTALRGALIITSFLQLAFICVNFDTEDVLQRKIAIAFTLLRVGNLMLQLGILIYVKSALKTGKFFIASIFSINYMVVQLITLFILIKDLSLFGSGLREYSRLNSVLISLS